MHAKRLILVTSAAAVLAVPGVASAHHGKDGSTDARADGKRHGGHHGHHHHHFRSHKSVVSGVVTARDAAAKTVTITVAPKVRKAVARHATGPAPAPTSVTLDVSSARIKAADTDGDGVKDELDDVRVGDTVAAWIAGGCKKDDGASTAKAKLLVDRTTAASVGAPPRG